MQFFEFIRYKEYIEEFGLWEFLVHFVFNIPMDMYRWVRDLINPHNVLHIGGLRRSWCDKDKVLLHAAFQILVNYVEHEEPFEYINWESEEGHQKAAAEIKDLYAWWKEGRGLRIDPLDNVEIPNMSMGDFLRWDSPEWKMACGESNRLEQLWFEEDQKNLHRLIEIRPYLWT